MARPHEASQPDKAADAPNVEISITPSSGKDPGVFDVTLKYEGRESHQTEINTTPKEYAFPRR